jgi:hypothetical protein
VGTQPRGIADDRQMDAARGIWTRINPRNRRENIVAKNAPREPRVAQGPSHIIDEVELRKLWGMS